MNLILKLSLLTLFFSISLLARSIDDIKASGEIVIAVYEDFPPYSFMEDGVPKGIDIELGKKVANSLNVKPIWYFTGSDENLADDLRNTIWRGNLVHKTKADVMFRIPYDYDYLRMTNKSTGELENEMVTIKGPYQSEKWIIATNKEIIPQIKTLAIFAYQTIGVEVDTLPDLHLSGFARGLLQKNIKHYTKFQEAINDFKNGKIDAIAGLKSQIEYLIDYKNNKDKYYLTQDIPQMKSQWDLATAVSSNYRDLSYQIDELLDTAYKNNEIKEIFENFGVEYIAPISKTQ
ncbi:MAG: transporter substrate-binding domain-containing protein [Aliarcobacter sp.]|nr:transporter substrate-binding domain-containing protein [Aliarcobacter sp.]